ncbi:MAG: hypothetical protein KJ069_23505 [Anaerolineae bacterium]|nr:hypothetical protein [Anaerolineae bacterium]
MIQLSGGFCLELYATNGHFQLPWKLSLSSSYVTMPPAPSGFTLLCPGWMHRITHVNATLPD